MVLIGHTPYMNWGEFWTATINHEYGFFEESPWRSDMTKISPDKFVVSATRKLFQRNDDFETIKIGNKYTFGSGFIFNG